MIDNAWEWADKHHKKRRNAVHGEEEVAIILDDEFLFRTENGEKLSQEGQFQLEDRYRVKESKEDLFMIIIPPPRSTKHLPDAGPRCRLVGWRFHSIHSGKYCGPHQLCCE